MKKLMSFSILVYTLTSCGGTPKPGETVAAPVELTEAYYIAEVGGAKGSGTTLSYFILLSEIPSEVRFDSAWVNGERTGLMQMPGRPLLRTAQGSDGILPELMSIKIRGFKENRPFFLESDSVYLKEKVFMPASQPSR